MVQSGIWRGQRWIVERGIALGWGELGFKSVQYCIITFLIECGHVLGELSNAAVSLNTPDTLSCGMDGVGFGLPFICVSIIHLMKFKI